MADLVVADPGAAPEVAILRTRERIPWAGHRGAYAMPDIMAAIKAVRSALLFVNTRSQAEASFQALWQLNDENLPIALHHGSLSVEQRRKVEQAMTLGKLRAVVCTSTLELGVDWGAIDLVIQLGAPKGSSRMMQRIGRSNHRLDEPSKAILVPANRFEVMECRAALDAVAAAAPDTPEPRTGALDVLAQHVLGMACAGGFAWRPPTHSGGCAATAQRTPPPAAPVHRHPQHLPTRDDGAMPRQSVYDNLNDDASLCELCWGDGHRKCQRARRHGCRRCRWLVGAPSIQEPRSVKWTGGPLAMTSAYNWLDARGWCASNAVGSAPRDILDMSASNVVANVGRNRPDGVVR